MNEMNINLRDKILRAKKEMNNIDLLRYELYAIFTVIILSRDIFKKNKEIKDFLESFNIEFKDYVFSTRTSIVSKVIRIIEKLEDDELKMYLKILEKKYNESNDTNELPRKESKKEANIDYIDGILKKYTRNRRNE